MQAEIKTLPYTPDSADCSPTDDHKFKRLTPWDPSLHEQVRDRMMLLGGGCGNGLQWERSGKNNGNHGVGAGLSWLDTDAMTYMTEAAKGLDYPDMNNSVRAERDRLLHGIERLDLSGVQAEDTGESGRSEVSMEPVSLPSTASFSSPEHRKLERTNGELERSSHSRTPSGEGQEEVTDC
ncbi:hypothetical protein Y032_0227g2839 [Ancylostoma ceylanicum]|uniref:Uncharacterized protein n=1 Tax=Ancylostoma ceylanicum TaxID=53326 RepID=A0A016SHQ5_9BILA|nr:hypothetical protein Y032_0227g2839 [Ancylostoma ceylanicum]